MMRCAELARGKQRSRARPAAAGDRRAALRAHRARRSAPAPAPSRPAVTAPSGPPAGGALSKSNSPRSRPARSVRRRPSASSRISCAFSVPTRAAMRIDLAVDLAARRLEVGRCCASARAIRALLGVGAEQETAEHEADDENGADQEQNRPPSKATVRGRRARSGVRDRCGRWRSGKSLRAKSSFAVERSDTDRRTCAGRRCAMSQNPQTMA